MKNKIVNLVFSLSIASVFVSYLFFSYSTAVKQAEAGVTQSLGARLNSATLETCPSGAPNTACMCTCASSYCAMVTPIGGTQLPIVCLPSTMETTRTPVTPAASGIYLLGSFSTLSQTIPSVPMGVVGTN